MKEKQYKEILSCFAINGSVLKVAPFGGGLINHSYKVTTAKNFPNYFLQQINSDVFKDVEGLCHNLVKSCAHMAKTVNSNRGESLFKCVLNPIKTVDDKWYYQDQNNQYWRLFDFIEVGEAHAAPKKNSDKAYKTGLAFGEFLRLMSDINAAEFYETIPQFHYTPMHIERLEKAITADVALRTEHAKEEIAFLLQRKEEYLDFCSQNKWPKRVIHQDTKVDNVLFDPNGEVLTVIDLDTVMPGYAYVDVGDAIRNGANTTVEDDEDVEKVALNFDAYSAIIRGYISRAGSVLTTEEVQSLPWGARVLTYEQAVRFLWDYLNGDKYYKCSKSNHNLIRARNQICLLQDMERQWSRMLEVVAD